MEIKAKYTAYTDYTDMEYFSKGIKICGVEEVWSSRVLPNEFDRGTGFCDVIEGMAYKLFSQFDLSSTIFPGRTRSVYDFQTGAEIYNIVYRNSNLYHIVGADFEIEVTINEKGYFFSYCGNDIAVLLREDRDSPYAFKGGFFDDTLDSLIIVAVLSFPSLRFAF